MIACWLHVIANASHLFEIYKLNYCIACIYHNMLLNIASHISIHNNDSIL